MNNYKRNDIAIGHIVIEFDGFNEGNPTDEYIGMIHTAQKLRTAEFREKARIEFGRTIEERMRPQSDTIDQRYIDRYLEKATELSALGKNRAEELRRAEEKLKNLTAELGD